jgi:phospholipid-binding lipoprotein MlaA
MRFFPFILILFFLSAGIGTDQCLAKEDYQARYMTVKGGLPGYSLTTDPPGLTSQNWDINRIYEDSPEGTLLFAGAGEPEREIEDDEDTEYLEEEEEDEIADPLETFNRMSFRFNDKLYFWFLKPIAKGYSAAVPERARISIRNVFDNVLAPARVVNNLLQFKIGSAGSELVRFGANTVFGVLGLFDFADKRMGIKESDEDLGQTLGVWGIGPGFYINWPLLGPSSLRDSIGIAGDYFLDPVSYINPISDSIAVRTGDHVNRTSLSIGQYEDLKKDAIDPYSALRDVYHQYQEGRVSR